MCVVVVCCEWIIDIEMAFMICDRQPMPRQRLFLIGLIVCLHVRSIWGGPAMFQVIDLSESVATPEISTHSEKPFHVVAIASDTCRSSGSCWGTVAVCVDMLQGFGRLFRHGYVFIMKTYRYFEDKFDFRIFCLYQNVS